MYSLSERPATSARAAADAAKSLGCDTLLMPPSSNDATLSGGDAGTGESKRVVERTELETLPASPRDGDCDCDRADAM